jgi:hypothetical protein
MWWIYIFASVWLAISRYYVVAYPRFLEYILHITTCLSTTCMPCSFLSSLASRVSFHVLTQLLANDLHIILSAWPISQVHFPACVRLLSPPPLRCCVVYIVLDMMFCESGVGREGGKEAQGRGGRAGGGREPKPGKKKSRSHHSLCNVQDVDWYGGFSNKRVKYASHQLD